MVIPHPTDAIKVNRPVTANHRHPVNAFQLVHRGHPFHKFHHFMIPTTIMTHGTNNITAMMHQSLSITSGLRFISFTPHKLF
jgi:hypothetical protein